MGYTKFNFWKILRILLIGIGDISIKFYQCDANCNSQCTDADKYSCIGCKYESRKMHDGSCPACDSVAAKVDLFTEC